MKKLIISGLFMLSTALLSAQGEYNYTIEGQITDIKDGTKIELQGEVGTDLSEKDIINNEKFSFRFHQISDDTIPVYLTVYDNEIALPKRRLWVAPQCKTFITGNGYETEIWNVENSLPIQIEENRYIAASRDELKQLQNYTIEASRISKQISDKGLSKDEWQRLQSRLLLIRDSAIILVNNSFNQELAIMRTAENEQVLMEKLMGYSIFFIQTAQYIELVQFRQFFNTLPKNIINSRLAAEIKKGLNPVATDLIGEPAFDKTLPDMDGNKHTIAEFRGKFLLLDFWASWCGPCMKAVPEVKKAHEIYKDKLTIAGINLDERDADWLQASQRHGITWQNLHDAGGFGKSLHKQYQGSSIPYYVLISPEGTILDIWAGYLPGDLLKRLEAYIK